VVLAAQYDLTDRRKTPVISLGVLHSVVGEMANVTIGEGPIEKTVIVPLSAVHKASKVEENLYARFIDFADLAYKAGYSAGFVAGGSVVKAESVPYTITTTPHTGFTFTDFTDVPASMQVVERAEDVMDADKAFKDDFVKVVSVDEAAAIINGTASFSGATFIQVGGLIADDSIKTL
jgi:hypothetical protein